MNFLTNMWGSFLEWGADTSTIHIGWALALFVAGAAAINAKSQWATIPHELGHALVALALGKRLVAINIRRDSSGEAVTSEGVPASLLGRVITSPFRWVRAILVSLAGYLGPFGYAWGVAGLWAAGYSRFAIIATLILLCFTLLYIRNGFGFLLTFAGIVLVGGLAYVNSTELNQAAAAFLVGGMIAGGIRGVVEAWLVCREDMRPQVGREPQHSDARALARRTLIPQVFWLGLFTAAGLFVSYRIVALMFIP